MKLLNVLTLATLILLSCEISAQSYVEAGGFIGLANYQGDLSQDPIEFGATKASFGGVVRYHYSSKLHFSGSVIAGQVSGDDKNAEVGSGVYDRNWSFTANLLEVAFAAEWIPFGKPRFNSVGIFRPQINPYLTIGIGSTFVKDELNTDESGIPLSDLKTSIPEPDDKDNFLVFPIGGGLRFDFTQWSTLSAGLYWRYTNSDYIDGVSKNGSDNGPDWYFFWGATLTTYFGEQEDFGL